MSLKEYQERIMREVHGYLRLLDAERKGGRGRYASQEAWRLARVPGQYTPEDNGLGEDLPRLCVKVPTGGGKTLLATQMLGSVMNTILSDRNGAGLVLWVVPSSQIYRDTLRALKERGGFLRTMLEHAVSRKVELWEKSDIVRLTPSQLKSCLNILVLQLASTNRETKDQLKFFKDAGGNITLHFPAEDDPAGHAKLKGEVPNLDMIEDDPERGRCLIKTSVGNLVKLCRPAVVLDEGHKATSDLAQRTLREFNASIILELSATPRRGANIISRASGDELLREEMIKLPLNIAVSGARDWKDLLTRARDKRDRLQAEAAGLVERGEFGQFIRPIVLVQVERTGKDQRDGKHIHAEDVRDHLTQRLGVNANAIAVKSSEKDELVEHTDLMDEGCPITWIITKAALQEGWDCPFAYVLVSLDNTGSERAMTQLIGRVLRQPFQRRTPEESLNQCYVYCLRATAGAVSNQVKRALEQEGYEGDLESAVSVGSEANERETRTVRIRTNFSELYRKPFEGKVYLPHFCVRDGKEIEPLDYFRHLVARVDVDGFAYGKIDWKLDDALAEAKDRFYSVTLGGELQRRDETEADLLENDEQVIAWMAASMPFEYLSFKQLRRAVRRVYERLMESELQLAGRFGLVKYAVRERLERFVVDEVNRQTEAAFAEMFKEDRVCFYLECRECRFEVPDSIEIRPVRRMQHANGDAIGKSLFDYVEDETENEYERAVALCLDRQEQVLWWYRNLVGSEHFAIQGPRRERVRPDFVVKRNDAEGHEVHDVLVLESKGKHLQGNKDTSYKRSVAKYFEQAGRRVRWQQLGDDFNDHQFRFQVLDEVEDMGRDWRDLLAELINA
ncbi:MAG: DEAD/DEAH box helicase [Phycisphaerales bacterium]